MLLVNLSSSLVNGQCGEVKGFGENYVEVFFPKLKKTVKIHSYNFSVYSKELHRDVASRRQIPLKLAFAMTTHKAQGLTLDRIEIDCRYMTNPGQIEVAVGRCRNMKGLRIINYSNHLVKKKSIGKMFTTYILTHFCQFCPTYYAAKLLHSWNLSLWNLYQILRIKNLQGMMRIKH